MVEIVLGLLIIVALGVATALPVLILPIRKTAQRNPLVRIIMMVSCALVAFSILYAALAWLNFKIALVFYNIPSPPGYTGPLPNPNVPELADVATRELWIRQMMPVQKEDACYTTPAECAAADEVIRLMRAPEGFASGPTAVMVLSSLIPAAISMRTVWHFTTQDKRKRLSGAIRNLQEQDLYA